MPVRLVCKPRSDPGFFAVCAFRDRLADKVKKALTFGKKPLKLPVG